MDESPISNLPFYRSLPKVDLHRHLEGSLRFDTVRELARAHGMGLPGTTELRGLVQVQEAEGYSFTNFLAKFSTLRMFYRSPEIIGRITREAIADAAADGVRYLELRFTPAALSKAQGFPLSQVMDWVIESAHRAEREFGVMTRLIASVNRHESLPLAAQVANLAAERRESGIVGLDLAGDESCCPPARTGCASPSTPENGARATMWPRRSSSWGQSGWATAYASWNRGAPWSWRENKGPFLKCA